MFINFGEQFITIRLRKSWCEYSIAWSSTQIFRHCNETGWIYKNPQLTLQSIASIITEMLSQFKRTSDYLEGGLNSTGDVSGPGWGLPSQFPPFRYFPNVHIWRVSPQLSCGDACQMWMWLKKSNRYFCKIENYAYGAINKRSFSNPPPRAVSCAFTA